LYKLVSWNVNGLRAIAGKGFVDMLKEINPDIMCLQEIKAEQDQLPKKIQHIEGYHAYFNSSQTRKGYSGTAIYTKKEPLSISHGLGNEKFDQEGRIQFAEYETFYLYNIYYPNGQSGPERLQYKLEFYDYFLEHAKQLMAENKAIVVCGDVNTAHHAIDLARPQENINNSGFLPEERAWLDKFIESGLIDTFRIFNQEPDNYTYWDYKTRARDRNVGWRIDYFYISQNLRSRMVDAAILNQYYGSDHCPISLILMDQ
jgi:exodeoxyribonuclease-3